MGWGERQDKRYRECVAEIVGQMDKIAKMLEERFDIEHEGGLDFDPEHDQ